MSFRCISCGEYRGELNGTLLSGTMELNGERSAVRYSIHHGAGSYYSMMTLNQPSCVAESWNAGYLTMVLSLYPVRRREP